MQKILRLLLAVGILFSIVSCGNNKNLENDSASIKYKAGKYVSKKEGHNGTLEIEVEFSENSIKAINVLKSDETKTLTDLVFEKLPKEIIDNQSLNVDVLSGASITSQAFLSAVEDCVTQAGANVKDLKKSDINKSNPQTIELKTDVLVVGGGGAGLSAAIRADQEGLGVILIEKNAMLGGHTALSGAYSLITGSKLQKEKYGITNDTVKSVYDDNFKNGQGKSIPGDLMLFAENMGPASDWLNDYVKVPAPEKLTPLSENSVDRAIVYVGGGKGLNDTLVNFLKKTKVDVHLSTKAEKLIVDSSNKVIGVEAKDVKGNIYKITAKATVLATGSYGAKKDLLPKELNNFIYYGAQLAQGEGMLMAQKIGADVVNQGYVELFENGVEWHTGIAKSTYSGSMATWKVSGILVDRNGKRVVNETAPGIEIVKEMSKQQDGRLFLLMDSNTFKAFRDNVAGYGISQEMLDKWLANNGSQTPYFVHGNTLEEVASILKIDGTALKNTVARYNSFVDKGVDEDFGRNAKKMTAKIGEGPYYLVEQKPRYATTLGGLKINENLQVMNTSNQVIEGLFAIGDVAGGARGSDSIPGADVGWALTSGYKVGEILSKLLSK